MLLVCVCVASCFRLADSKQHLLSHSLGLQSGHSLAGTSAQGLTTLQSSCWLGCIFIWWPAQGKSTSQLLQVVGRIHFSVVGGLRSCSFLAAGQRLPPCPWGFPWFLPQGLLNMPGPITPARSTSFLSTEMGSCITECNHRQAICHSCSPSKGYCIPPKC